MSFQDVGKRNSQRPTATAGLQQNQTSRPASTGGWGIGGGGSGSVAQISESLTQYQRNVGILEKIAQQLLTSTSSNRSARTELEQQYKAQLDVLRQLEQRLRDLILNLRKSASASDSQRLQKLERDFERVQATAQSCSARVTRQQKQYQQRGDAAALQANNAAANTLHQEQQRFQMQVQEDRLHEEIMREREEEIRNINKGMHKVNEIYRDLAHIVSSQQEMIDEIETQMDDARGNAESGLTQVQKANEKYDNANCVIS